MYNQNKCSICKSIGVNASTCPLNDNALKHKYKKHYLTKNQIGGLMTSIGYTGPIGLKMSSKLPSIPYPDLKNTKIFGVSQAKNIDINKLNKSINNIFNKIIPELITCNSYKGQIINSQDFIDFINQENTKYSKLFTDSIASYTGGGVDLGVNIINSLKNKYGSDINFLSLLKQTNTKVNNINEFNTQFADYYYLIAFVIYYILYSLNRFYTMIIDRSGRLSEKYTFSRSIYCGLSIQEKLKQLQAELVSMQKIIGYNKSKSTDVQKYINDLIIYTKAVINFNKKINETIAYR